MKRTATEFSKYFFLFFIMIFLFTLFICFTYTSEEWFYMIFQYRFQGFPLIFYLFFFSVFLTFIMLAYMKSYERKKLKKVEEGLKMMSKGHYSASIFLDMYSLDTPLQVNKEIDRQFIKLHEKLMRMAEEAIIASQRSTQMSNETKIEILENERHRIARELHDSVSQQLFAASMMLSAVNQQSDELDDKFSTQLNLIEKIINDSQTEMRALLLHLRPVKLDGKTLKQGVEQLLKELCTKINTEIRFEIEDVRLAHGIEDHLFRIVQELLSNVLRHAKAEELEVYLKRVHETVLLRMIDDGVGFDMSHKKSGSYGLENIRERINGIGGDVKIISFPEKGTSIEISIPIVAGGEK
ncbi:sensor histidine kinase [Marinilactibacillus sp. GCM10026970]|uniref:sensor histidine kinase n=1 Tax=Marinilactibacillus sp. GCM10026970 TaxID=3252642 RepID=UPI00360EF4D0